MAKIHLNMSKGTKMSKKEVHSTMKRYESQLHEKSREVVKYASSVLELSLTLGYTILENKSSKSFLRRKMNDYKDGLENIGKASIEMGLDSLKGIRKSFSMHYILCLAKREMIKESKEVFQSIQHGYLIEVKYKKIYSENVHSIGVKATIDKNHLT